jgi:uracil-DNA glycosylase
LGHVVSAQIGLFPASADHAVGDVLRAADFKSWPCDPSWRPLVDAFAASEVGQGLVQRLQSALAAGDRVYPPQPLRALTLTPLSGVKVVVLGQDPYHGAGQANGLAFSVGAGVRIPPSLRNIFKEVSLNGGRRHVDGVLDDWARQGVLLLNTALTVRDGSPASHSNWGWATLTDAVIKAVAMRDQPAVFLLWGAHAQTKAPLIQSVSSGRHAILMSNHPSPLSASRPPLPFVGNGHFKAANAALTAWGQLPIDW